tara:strand:+ start:37 stop:303 length:267 start_codon:yes stop_codon:yes gene_type:complete
MKKTEKEIRDELTDKYYLLLERIELIKKKQILAHTVDILNQLMEFVLKARSTDTFTLDVYKQQSKNLDTISSKTLNLENLDQIVKTDD